MSTQPSGQRMAGWLKHLPCMVWLPGYDRHTFSSDAVAALIVTVLLIPQSLAYAMLAGLPAEVGLYASMAPLLAYAVLGTSRVLAVGPVAITALMAATALGQWATPGSPAYLEGALVLALLSGLMLMSMAVLQLGFLANFLSNPVTSGFVSASSVLIALSQTGHLLGDVEHPDLHEACDKVASIVDRVRADQGLKAQSRERAQTLFSLEAMLGKFLSLCMPLMPESENDASMELPPMRLMQA